jgi:hypothetical protein
MNSELRRASARNARVASPHRGMRCARWCDSTRRNGSSLEPWRNAGAQARRTCEIPIFLGLAVFAPVSVSRRGGGGRISGGHRSGPARWSNFDANEIEGRGYRISTTSPEGPARSSRACAREMESILFESDDFRERLRSILKCVDRDWPYESFQSVSGFSEYVAKFRKGESPSISSCALDGCAP